METEARPALNACWLGRLDFEAAMTLQLAAREALAAEEADPVLYLVEHPAVLTVGRRGSDADILWTDAQLAERAVQVVETPRGGEVTLHAPGQLVVYPIRKIGRQIRAHLHDLAETSLALLRELGVNDAVFSMEHPGIWRGETKLGSIGVHISRGITIQGLSLNLAVDPALFGALVSCGMQGLQMCSVADVVGETLPVERAARRWAELWAERLGCQLAWIDPPAG